MEFDQGFVTVSQAAQELGYTVQHVRWLLRSGKLAGTKLGRDWLVSRDSVLGIRHRQISEPLIPYTTRGRHPKRKESAS